MLPVDCHRMLTQSCQHTHYQKSRQQGRGCQQVHKALRNSTVFPPGSQANSHPWMRQGVCVVGELCHSSASAILLNSFHPARRNSGMYAWDQLSGYTAITPTLSGKHWLHHTLAGTFLEKTKYKVSLRLSQVPVMQLLPGPILGVIRGFGPLSSFLYAKGTQARFSGLLF